MADFDPCFAHSIISFFHWRTIKEGTVGKKNEQQLIQKPSFKYFVFSLHFGDHHHKECFM